MKQKLKREFWENQSFRFIDISREFSFSCDSFNSYNYNSGESDLGKRSAAKCCKPHFYRTNTTMGGKAIVCYCRVANFYFFIYLSLVSKEPNHQWRYGIHFTSKRIMNDYRKVNSVDGNGQGASFFRRCRWIFRVVVFLGIFLFILYSLYFFKII